MLSLRFASNFVVLSDSFHFSSEVKCRKDAECEDDTLPYCVNYNCVGKWVFTKPIFFGGGGGVKFILACMLTDYSYIILFQSVWKTKIVVRANRCATSEQGIAWKVTKKQKKIHLN